MKLISAFSVLIVCVLASSCDKNDQLQPVGEENNITGTGAFTFVEYAPFSTKPIEVHYHIPVNSTTVSPILMVFHGSDRNGATARDAFISKANEQGFIVIAPTFADVYFEGGDGYNLANIFSDGDNPSEASLNPQEEWTFSVIDPLFEYVKELTGNTSSTYDVFGFSAGAQIAHRMLIFDANAKVNRMVAASAGWYTVPDDGIIFPYGLDQSPAETADLAALFASQLTIIVGTADNDPNAPGLRHNEFADAQGLTRFDRAQHFYNEGFSIASDQGLPFGWQYQSVPNVGHDQTPLASVAADLLY